MATFVPPPAYTAQQLAQLYPSSLELRQVQVIFRHGERTPVHPRLQNTGLPAHWPYCASSSRFTSAVLAARGSWDTLSYRRRLETFGPSGAAVLASAPGGIVDHICRPGELTDIGRQTTLALGARLRKLYVDELRFLPPAIGEEDTYYLRATPIQRALESLQQVFTGLYPSAFRPEGHIPVIISRSPQDENLFPNEANCRRFSQLARAFAAAAAEKWNGSEEMGYLQEKLGVWMPAGQKVAVDASPRLSGLMDTINATLAHGEGTKLPGEFYDPEVRRIMNMVNVEEWFRGYKESSEYRRLGVGSLLNDIATRSIAAARGETAVKLALMGCHDTTIAGLLASLGAFDEIWPPFTSSIAVETFRVKNQRKSFWGRFTTTDRDEGWFVRVRYNEKPVVLAGCRKEGRHLQGDEAFCTMKAFREAIDKVKTEDWKGDCARNLELKGLPEVELVE
ncbi:histidine phosphatase superfamily [Pyronema domesticum]|uniref:3-phytase n=1 Tax=Pyronema omphalodes (strain CBS 100304) TaxID=1076935 RepID=U4LD51_PYROM|nr:histidine phosphatase superfamily [Pyronema domesticum]CCX12333.1 Similar to Probable acid phosphatase SPBC4.06; acc. no. Q9USS6 [Pyronema omphalodes CBS 100304]